MAKVLGVDTDVFSATPTITSGSAYAAGNCVGGLITLASVPAHAVGYIQGASITDVDGQDAATDVYLFSDTPSGSSTITDKTQINIATADLPLLIGTAHLATADWTLLGTTKPGYGMVSNLAFPFRVTSGSTICAAIVTRGTPTWASTTSISLTVNIMG